MKKLRKQFLIPVVLLYMLISLSGCLKSGYKELVNSSAKDLTSVNYTYRFLYNDTIQKGTPKEEIQNGRVCEVVFAKVSTPLEINGMKGFTTTITHSINSVMKAGPTGSVTRQMLYDEFKRLIQTDQLRKLWVFVAISDVAKVLPQGGAPELGKGGDFSQDRIYRVKAADGSFQDYILRTIKGF